MWVAAIPSKSCATEKIKSIQARAEVEAGAKLKVLWTDRGGEFTEYCIGDGMNRQLTTPYYPQ
jgi:hypothetical protein